MSTNLRVATWIDVCDECEHGLATMTTTITSLHCGCTDTPAPTIPMTTTTKTCAVCGEGGAAATIMITCPQTSAIAFTAVATSSAAATGIVPITISVARGGAGRNYGNVSVPASEAASSGIPGGAAGLASPASTKQLSVVGSGEGATPARSVDVPFMSSSTPSSHNFGATLLSGIGSPATLNASVAGPTGTFILKFSNGAGAVCFKVGGVSFAFLVAILLL